MVNIFLKDIFENQHLLIVHPFYESGWYIFLFLTYLLIFFYLALQILSRKSLLLEFLVFSKKQYKIYPVKESYPDSSGSLLHLTQRIQQDTSFDTFFYNSPIGLYRISCEGDIIIANKSLAMMLGYNNFDDLVGRNLFEIYKNNGGNRTEFIITLKTKGKIVDFEDYIKLPDKSLVYIKENTVSVRDKKGNILYYEGRVEDITEKRKIFRALRITEEKYKSFINQVPVGIYRITAGGEILFSNNYLAELLGLESADELKGISVFKFFDNPRKTYDIIKQIILKKKDSYTLEYKVKRTDGKRIWVYDSAKAVYDTSDEILFFDGIIEDISARKEAEEALIKSENKFFQLADLMPETIYEIDIHGNFLYLNDASFEAFGYNKTDKLPNAFDLFIEKDKKRIQENIKNLLDEKKSHGHEYTAIKKDGSTFPVIIYSLPVKENDIIKGFRGIVVNITDLMQAEYAVKESEEKYRTLVEKSNDGIAIHREGQVIFANQRASQMLEYSPSDTQSLNLFNDVIAPEEREKLFNYHNERLLGHSAPELYETVLITKKTSKRILVEINNSVIFYKGQKAIISIFRDLTFRKQSEDKLSRLNAAINQTSEGIVITDTKGNIDYVNPAFEKMTFYSIEEIKGKNIMLLDNGQSGKKFYDELWAILLADKDWAGILVDRKKNGEKFDSHTVISPVKDGKGEIVSFVAVIRDITEERKLEQQLRQSQKLQAIGTLAGGIAHDFNNILMGMQVFTELLLKKFDSSSVEHSIVRKIYNSETRAKDLVKQILSFSRQSGDEMQPISIHDVVEEALQLIKSTLPSSIKVKTNIQDSGKILGNPTQIHQIVMNLCTNASHAMQGQGTLTVELERSDFLEKKEKINDKKDSKWIRLMVKDNGCGIDKKLKDRIFEPFFTTKAVGQGTGLGLATVHGIVKRYGGEIFFSSQIKRGTVFYIYLPAL